MKRPFNFFYIGPAGAIRGDKNIAHRLHWRGRPGRQQPGGSAGCSVSRVLFSALPEQTRALGARRPASHTMGSRAAARKKRERSGTPASGTATPSCRFRDFAPVSGCASAVQAGGAAACLPLRDSSPPLRPGAPGALAGAGRRAVLIRKGPRKTGALADVGLSGPQACAVPVRAASRKGDQPAGRPARRAPGSYRCCDRW